MKSHHCGVCMCMRVHTCMCVHACLCSPVCIACIYTCVCLCACVYIHVCARVHVCVYAHMHTYVYVHICVHVCAHVCMCVYTCVHVYRHWKVTLGVIPQVPPTVLLRCTLSLPCSLSSRLGWLDQSPKDLSISTSPEFELQWVPWCLLKCFED